MSVDDIAVQGAEPLFFLDYISIGKLVPEIVDDIVGGVAHGCVQAGCALLGGEMSEHPDLMEPGEFDLVGFAVGVVERGRVLPERRAGRRRDHRLRQPRAALQRLLARPPRAARPGRPSPRRPRLGRRAPLARRRADPPERDLRPDDAEARANGSRCTRSRTSPAAASPTTSPGSCPSHCDAVVLAGRLGRAADLRRDPVRRRRRRRRDGARVQPGGRDGGRRGPGRPFCHVGRGPIGGSGSLDRRRGVRRPRSGKYQP